MVLDMLPWLGLAAQLAGALLLAFSGGFGLGSRKYSHGGVIAGLAFFGFGCVGIAAFAFGEGHLLLVGVQLAAAVLVGLGVTRKMRERRGPL